MDDLIIDGTPHTTYQNLANAIILNAVEDYREALRTNNKAMQLDCETFFLSEWFVFLCNLTGDWLMTAIIKEIENENHRTEF